MNAFRRRVAGGLLVSVVRAVAAGSLVGVVGSSVASSAGAQVRQAGAVQILRAECTECHARTHQGVLGHGTSASLACATCHAGVHDSILAFYAGRTARRDVGPDPMYTARVGCAECHTAATLAFPDDARLAALDRMCTSCHGASFAGLGPRWIEGLSWRTRAVSAYVSRASGRVRVDAATRAVKLVATGGGPHNVRAADALLRSALDSVAAAFRAARLTPPEPPALGPDPKRVSCLGCHYGIEGARATICGEQFDHGAHVLRGDVACSECHSAADYLVPGTHDVDRRHGRTMLTAASCDACHHAPSSTTTCTTCHTGDVRLGRSIAVRLPLHLQPAGAPTSREVTFEHVDHPNVACARCHDSTASVRTVATCASCHESHHREAVGCAKCHGTEVATSHRAADHLTCARCHARETVAQLLPDRSFCLSCHADRADHKSGRECSTCHMQRSPSELRRRILAAPR